MNNFTAKQAKKLTNEAIKSEFNVQRKYYLNKIKLIASDGKNNCIISEPNYHLYENDWKFFEKLGYKITEPITRILPRGMKYEQAKLTNELYYTYEYGIISW